MTYRSILTYADGDTATADRLASAIAVTRQFDAHLTVLALGYQPNLPPYVFGEASASMMDSLIARATQSADENFAAATELLSRQEIRHDVVRTICRAGSIAAVIGTAAQFADLVITSQAYGKDVSRAATEVFEGALLDSDAGVLLCPDAIDRIDSSTVLIAWNSTREALRAVRRAMPVLASAERVEIVMIDPPAENQEPGQRLATLLSRHGVNAEIVILPQGGESVAGLLQQSALEKGAGLLVMGGYGHSRFREYVIGGATRVIGSEARLPVLLAH